MNSNLDLGELAAQRTLLAAERTFSAWIRTGLAALGGGLAIVRALDFGSILNRVVSQVIGGLLVVWAASIFIYAIIGYRRICVRLSQEGISKNSSGAMILITAVLLIVFSLVLCIILQ